MGYRHNQQPFLALAARAPYRALARAAAALPPEQRAGALESWLLKLSGLLPAEEASAIALPRVGLGRPMTGREWHCFRVRPGNHPRRRITGAARLLARHTDSGLLGGLERAAAGDHPRELTGALAVPADAGRGPAYIGAGRARDLAVNVVLPLLHGAAAARGETGPAAHYLARYHRFGRLQDNALTREMAEGLLEPGWGPAVDSARRQQGLVHLHRLLAGAGG